jgi:ferredoxin
MLTVFTAVHNAVIRVYNEAGNVIQTHEHTGEFKGDFVTRLGKRHARGEPESGYCLINSRASSAILFASSIQFLLMLNFTFTVKTMADVANKYAENVAGAFYVDDQCIDCDLCRETAPASFKRNDDGGHTYVYKQPETPEEEALCKEAMEGCPVEAIGNDGAIILAPLRA